MIKDQYWPLFIMGAVQSMALTSFVLCMLAARHREGFGRFTWCYWAAPCWPWPSARSSSSLRGRLSTTYPPRRPP